MNAGGWYLLLLPFEPVTVSKSWSTLDAFGWRKVPVARDDFGAIPPLGMQK